VIPRWLDTDADVLAEALAALRREDALEWRAEDEACEAEDRDRAERGTRDQDARA
jgi:hypothetical protein